VTYALANADLKQNKYKEAYDLAVSATKSHPTFEAEAWATAADAALGDSRKQDAVEALKKAIALDPKNPQHRLALSSAYVMMAMIPEAVASCREALKLAPNELSIHFALADTVLRGNTTDEQTREALSHLQTVAANREKLPANYMRRVDLRTGECYLRLRDWDQARTWLEKAALADPYDYESRNDLVRVYRHMGFTVEAGKTAQAAARLAAFEREKDHYKLLIARSNDPADRIRLARLYISVGLIHKAKGEYLEVLRAHPDNEEATANIMALVDRHPELKDLTEQDLSDIPGPATSP
jgi:tetratricopeptide (TPR) repeat protein